MTNITIKKPKKITLTINDNENQTISFDPFSADFVRNFKKLADVLSNFEVDKIEEIDEIINKTFGENATKYLFDNEHNLEMYVEFFTQIKDIVAKVRENNVNKYINE